MTTVYWTEMWHNYLYEKFKPNNLCIKAILYFEALQFRSITGPPGSYNKNCVGHLTIRDRINKLTERFQIHTNSCCLLPNYQR